MRTLIARSLFICLLAAHPLQGRIEAQKRRSRPSTQPALRPISSPRFAPLDAIVNDAIATHQVPGAVVVIGHNGAVVYRKAFGDRALEPKREPMTLDTIFDMASLTKPMATAMSIMRLVELGQVRLNEPFTRYMPECAKNGKEEITIRQLLTHYSGLRPDFDLDPPWTGYAAGLKLACDETPVTPPGSRFIYSDTNFILLGELVTRVSKMPLNQYAEAHIFAPLGLKYTRFLPPAAWLPHIAPTQYEEGAAGPMLRGVVHDPRARRMGGVAGHAGLFSRADDVAKFAQAVLDHKILSPLTIEKMTTPQQPINATSLRGLGWDLDTSFSSNRGDLLPIGSFGHTGFTGTSLWIDPTTKTYIAILANGVHPSGHGSAIALRNRVATAVAAALDLTPSEKEKVRTAEITGYNELLAGMRRVSARNGKVLTGIDVLEATNFAALRGPSRDGSGVRKIGLITNQTGLDAEGRRTLDVLARVPGIELKVLFSPEHGFAGQVDTTNVPDAKDEASGIPIFSTYGPGGFRKPAPELLRSLDAIVYDIQDAGARFYTYETTAAWFLEPARDAGVEFIVLDRPNPITGSFVQGPISDPGTESFVNWHQLPVRHGLTIGEAVQLYNGERKIGAKVTVVPMRGWFRGDWFDSTSLLWVNPSPNLRSMTAAALYTGVALVEGTNVSVGRGTDTPFEIVGAPWITPRPSPNTSSAGSKPRELAAYLNDRYISGVRFVPVTFTPAAGSKFGGQLCGGVGILLLDRTTLDAPHLGIEIASALHKLYPADFALDKMKALVANARVMDALARGEDPRRIVDDWRTDLENFVQMRQKYLIYK